MKKVIILFIVFATSIHGYKSQVLNNYATTTDNIFNLSLGMSLDDVTKTLKAEPTDLYSNIIENQKIVVYKYRKNYQEVSTKTKDDATNLRGGKKVYKDENNLYVVLDSKTNTLLYFITDSGRKSGKTELNQALKVKRNK
jgi:hypothetical protein